MDGRTNSCESFDSARLVILAICSRCKRWEIVVHAPSTKPIYPMDFGDLKLIRKLYRCDPILVDALLLRALEAFIRAKYEQRKWIAKEWIPPEITVMIDSLFLS